MKIDNIQYGNVKNHNELTINKYIKLSIVLWEKVNVIIKIVIVTIKKLFNIFLRFFIVIYIL